ncbi:MAG: hypothetical protein GX542_12975 [Rhodococcus sp.]|nr:hypothetical protein [Rhodococcus sp. (in: high G+C Gram-positive bacteria)]
MSLSDWQGGASTQIGQALLRCATQTSLLGDVATRIGAKVDEAATGLAEAKRLVELIPDPPATAELAQQRPFMNLKAADYQRDEADMEAANVLRTIYASAMVAADTDVPVLPPPFDPTGQQP